MSDSAKKKLKQMRLPFAIIASESEISSPKADENKDENSSQVNASRKRKPSSDGDNSRSNKIGRVLESKENIAAKSDIIDIADSDEELQNETVAVKPVECEKTPTSAAPESVLHIKLPSCAKSKRKVNMDLRPHNSEEDDDDSVVYLNDEEVREIRKKLKKSAKKSEKKKKKKESQVSEVSGVSRVKKALNMSDSDSGKVEDKTEETEVSLISDEELEPDQSRDQSNMNNTECSATSHDLKNVTPKQLARRQELESRRLEKELQRQRERDLKEQQRLKEKEQREEAKRKEKEEKEEARKREKEERERKRQAEQDKKDEEKRLKEEERKRTADQREEEKRQKEEERKRQAEQRDEEKRKREEAAKKKEIEEENRKKRAAEAFSKFFVAKKKNETKTTVAEDEISKDIAICAESSGIIKSNFMPFQIRERMTVAPCVRLRISKDQLQTLDDSLKTVKPLNELYLNELCKGLHKPKFSEKTLSNEEKEDESSDVVFVDELEGVGENIQADDLEIKMKHRAKFLFFAENRRPAYHGTWRKKTTHITARRPFGQDPKFFDYEVDSDDEWEEEEPGESLHGSDSEKEKEVEDDYEVDNDFLVPHGHLSDEEMQQMDDEVDEDNRPEAQKAKLKILQQEFAAEMKKKTEKIKPRLIGCIWMNGDEDDTGCSTSSNEEKKYHCSDIIWRILKAREMMTSEGAIKMEDDLEPEVTTPEEEVDKTSGQSKPHIRAKITEENVKQLIKLIHGNLNNKKFIIREFQAYRLKNFHKDSDFQEFSVKSVEEKMMEISEYKTCPEEGSLFGKKCWLVKPEVISEYFSEGEETLKLPNEWSYILEKEVKEKKTKPQVTIEGAKKENPLPMKASVEPKVVAEKPKETEDKPQPAQVPVVKKRVQLLMSVPRGEEISQTKKNNLINHFLKSNQEAKTNKGSKVDDVVVID